MKVRYKQRTSTPGGTVAWPGDVRELADEKHFRPELHDEVHPDTTVSPERLWDEEPAQAPIIP